MTDATLDATKPGRWRRLAAAPGGIVEAARLYGLGLRLVVRGAPGPSAVFLAIVVVTIAMPILQVWLARELLNGLADANQTGSGFGRDLLVPTVLYVATIVVPAALVPATTVVNSIIEDRAVRSSTGRSCGPRRRCPT